MSKPMTQEEFKVVKERAYFGSRALLDFDLIQMSQADVLPLIAEVERLRKGLKKIENKTSDESIKTIVQVTLDPTEYERYKNPDDPF